MDFVTVIFFQILYYLRPQEWPIGLSSVRFVLYTMLAGLASLSFRERGFNVRDIFRTPHDWAVLAFWLWIVFASPEKWDTFKETANLYIFYIVIVQTLYSVPRMNKYVGWWTFLICTVAGLALLSLYGFDPLESLNLTRGVMKDRLVLNLSIFNNPNALGHSVVPAIPLLYYFCIWKNPIALRVIGVALMVMVGYCIFLTESKGAYLCGAATILATATFGRPKSVQILIVAVALLFGTNGLSLLPRMSELKKTKTDEAIQGRVMAFTHGRKVLTATGIGYRNWYESFLSGKYRFKRTKFDKESLKRPMPVVSKAPHSSYVCIGAETGYGGFFLHMGILYCGLRSLMSARTSTPDEERVRRILFVLTVSYMVSSWIVNFEYRPTFFMFAAATAALHRHLMGIGDIKPHVTEATVGHILQPSAPAWGGRYVQPELAGRLGIAGGAVAVLPMEASPVPQAAPKPDPAPRPMRGIAFGWNRIGLLDLAVITAMTYAGIRFWDHLIKTM
ncbi:MAG: hypothetical protein K8R23_06330 [Chthoniobacter sp.]|nr:hypothetical protein [Chthoniobacter sp.]